MAYGTSGVSISSGPELVEMQEVERLRLRLSTGNSEATKATVEGCLNVSTAFSCIK